MKNNTCYKPDFLMIPIQLYEDSRIEPMDRDVYAVCYWYEHLKDGECRASNDKIACVISGASTRAIQNSLTKLEDCGYIARDYKDEAKRNRMRIRTLIAFKYQSKLVRSGGDRQETSAVLVTDERSVGDSDERSVGDQNKNIVNKNRIKIAPTSGAGVGHPKFNHQGSEVIKAFESFNPSVKKYYGNTTQRKSCDRLIELHGLEKVLKVVAILPKTNTLQYVPTITTPLQLEEKWAALESAMLRKKAEHIAKTEKYKVAFN